MAKAIETLSIKLEFKDAFGTQQVLDKIKSSFKGLDRVITGSTRPAIQKLRDEINTFASAGNRSISNIDAQVTALRALRREADINSKEFKELTADISKFEKQLGKAQGRRPGQGGRALAATQMAGAAISGGIFGGPEGFGGAVLGGVLGGVPGSFAGAAIGAQVGMIRQSLGEVAKTVAEINSMKIALAGVSKSAEDYNKSFASVVEISKEFLFPIDKAIGEFTKLKAAVVGAGFGTEETTDVFKGFAAAILATGGDAEKLSGALLAASQVFSKGKVQAEELRGQIGERLPGAFATFAGSIGVSTQELDKMLRDGKVSTKSFVDFARTLFAQFSATAETLGSSPEKAGQRLQVALSAATLEFGGFFQNVGAGFQDYFTNLINFAIKNKESIKDAVADFVLFGENLLTIFKEVGKGIVEIFDPVFKYLAEGVGAFGAFANLISADISRGARLKEYEQTYGVTSREALQRTSEQRAEAIVPNPFDTAGRERAKLEQIDRLLDSALGKPGQSNPVQRLAEIRSKFDQFMPTVFASSLGNLPLPGNDPNAPGGTGGGRKDISEAAANARIAAIRLPEVPLFEREQAIRDQAKLARLAAESLEPQRKRVELEKISANENRQIAALHKEMNSVFKELGAGLAEQMKIDAELKASLEDRKFELGMISEEEYFQLQLARERKRLEGMGASDEQVEEQLDLFKKLNSNAPEDIIARRIGSLKKEMEGLTNLGNVAVRIGDAIGGSFQRNFQDIISGTKSVKEALSDFFADIAEAFLAMAAEIIAKQLVMITLQTILKALGAVMGGAPSAPVPKDGAAFQSMNAGVLDSLGGAGPIADPKGLFTPPTLGAPVSLNSFGANGGPAFGGSPMIVGERGPELFIPFTNGSITSSESLGADMANAMAVPFLPGGNRGGTTSQMLNRQENIQVNRQENLRQMSVPFTRSSEAAMVASAEQQTAEAISNPAPLDVRFESQSINGIEYVTAEQHQAGMAQAAQRGRALTLAALQNSLKARRRVGL